MFLNIFLLVIALCIDTFIASAAYATNGISLSAKQIVLINGICSICLGVSLMFGNLLDSLIPEQFTRTICFFSLLFLGCEKLADSGIRQYLRFHTDIRKDIHFGFSELRFIISIYGNPMRAVTKPNHTLSLKEILFFSLAMSIDSIVSGTMAAFMKIPVITTTLAAFIMGELFTYLGLYIGKKINTHCPKDISWLGGILFIILAITKR